MWQIALIISAATDAFFITGWIWLGTAVMATATPLYAADIVSIIDVATFCALGSFIGSTASFLAGRLLGHTRLISSFLQRGRVKTVSSRLKKSDSLAVVVFTGKFVGLLRPFYALILGANRSHFTSYLALEFLASVAWSLVWSTVLYLGVETISELLNIIFEHAKRVLNDQGYGLEKAIPTVVRGDGIKTRHLSSNPTIVFQFATEHGELHVEVSIEESKIKA